MDSYLIRAVEEDVRFAYRLLLGREPDTEGFAHYSKMVHADNLSALEIARIIMSSEEYSAKSKQSGGLREVEIDGVKLFPWEGDHLIGDNVSATEVYEPNVLPIFLDGLSEGDHVLDVGANVGIFSLLAANRIGANGRVYCIEPVARNVQSLCAGIHGNDFSNVMIFPVAASDRSAVVAVLRRSDSSNGIVDFYVSPSSSVDFVPTQRLDFLLHGISRLDVVKMDIEGHEPIAWKGLKSLVKKFQPRIFTEFSPVAIRNHSRIDPELYLHELFEFAGEYVTVLSRDHQQIRCPSVSAVMLEWQRANEMLGLNGELHLDLLVDPAS
ncbi:FkbM family methyltransferase [Dokdonella sp.]|uniref:FkbM family methyltransferase n=1 Tax=Dokdonella sp. TaxID=2291710 RepID=UPI0035271DD4